MRQHRSHAAGEQGSTRPGGGGTACEPAKQADLDGGLTSEATSGTPLARRATQDAEAHLQHHFASIQEIADSTTLPSLLPALSRALLTAADVETPLERLRWACLGLARAPRGWGLPVGWPRLHLAKAPLPRRHALALGPQALQGGQHAAVAG